MEGQNYHADIRRGVEDGSLRTHELVEPLALESKERLLQIYLGRSNGLARTDTEDARRLKLEIDALLRRLEQPTPDQGVALLIFERTGSGPSYAVFISGESKEILGTLCFQAH
ncbi:hypothetical protein LP419_32915 [Massilia sp. H-1]|nr:hypothetical protein LP419_32915 [Massilia sp. H-1]